MGLVAFDEQIRAHLSPRGGRRQFTHTVEAIGALEASGQTEAGSALRDIAGRLRRRGLVILISDLLVDPDSTRLAIQFLRHRGHEVLVFHLLDPGERELPTMRDARFVDPETGEEVPVNVADLRAEYREAVARALEEWRRTLVPQGVDYTILDTDQPLVHALRAYLRKRERLG